MVMNTIYRINAEMEHRKDVQKKAQIWAFVLAIILAGLLIAGACNYGG